MKPGMLQSRLTALAAHRLGPAEELGSARACQGLERWRKAGTVHARVRTRGLLIRTRVPATDSRTTASQCTCRSLARSSTRSRGMGSGESSSAGRRGSKVTTARPVSGELVVRVHPTKVNSAFNIAD
jgi:hypothetical protein